MLNGPVPDRNLGSVVTLEYQTDQTPRVTRRGSKEVANQILRDARRYGIPIVIDHKLSQGLAGVMTQEEIPEELYGSVAEYLVNLRLI